MPKTQLDPRTAAIAASLSAPRLGPYLAATNGNTREALRLYQWNVELSGAVYESLHLFEIILRNAIDRQLRVWNAAQTDAATGRPHSPDWLMSPARLLGRLLGGDLIRATSRAESALRTGKRGGRVPGHPDVLAQLMFGTWRYLLPDKDPGRRLLWNHALRGAFPHLAASSRDLVVKVDGIYRLRNRVAHLEPLLRSGLVHQQFNNMRTVLAAIDPVVEEWFTSVQHITPTLRARRA